jgi:hypothetical protein
MSRITQELVVFKIVKILVRLVKVTKKEREGEDSLLASLFFNRHSY